MDLQVGEKTITHSAGTSAGRALEGFRKVRASHPDLVSQLEIRASQLPMWTQSFCAGALRPKQLNTPAQSGKGTASAQCLLSLPDSDFAKQFKSLVRSKLVSLRQEHQALKTAQKEAWKVGPLEIVRSVVHAQWQMSEKNCEDQWVLAAAVRNGILAYTPNTQTGKLAIVTEQHWAKQAGFQMGSHLSGSETG